MKLLNSIGGILSVFCLAALFSSCAKEIDENGKGSGRYLSSFEADIVEATKTEVDMSTGKVSWENGDSIIVSNGQTMSVFVYDKTTGRFRTDTPIEYTDGFKAVYPASIVKGLAEGGFTMDMPKVQTYHEGIVKEAPLWAETTTAEFNFINVCTILVIKATSDKQLSAMSFTSNEKAVCGEATLTAGGLAMADDGDREINLSIPTPVQLGTATPFYLVVPAQVYTGGFALKLDYTDDTSLYEGTTKTIALTAGHISALAAFKQIYFSGGMGTVTNPWRIATVEDLNFLSDNTVESSSTFRNEYYEQVCDIDFSGASFTPVGRLYYFLGTYDGKGHKILNCKISNTGNPAALFANLGDGGQVKNLVLDASTVSGNVNKVGGIVGYSNGGTITNCTVSETCVIKQTVAKKHELGGIVGSAISTSTVSGCTFNGTLSGPCGNVGGIAGNVNGTTLIDACQVGSSATITGGSSASTESGCNIGGVVGYMNGAASSVTAIVQNCTSAATLTTHYCDNGGIVGRINNGTVTGCVCTGTINCDFDDSAYSDEVGKETTHSNTGGIVGWVGGNYTSLGDCTSKATVNTSNRYVGGVLGFANNGSIYNCDFVDGTLTAVTKAGGIAGYLYNNGVRGCHVRNSSLSVSGGTGGGVAGYGYACMISDCHYEQGSTLTGGGKGKHNMGGIAGVIYANAGIIKDCTVGGSVKCSAGIVGGAAGLVQYGLIRNTVLKSTAEISSIDFNYVGGMAGQIDSNGGYVMDCSVESGAKVTAGVGQGIGGMVGYMQKGEVSGCNVDGITMTSPKYYIGGIVGQLAGNATDGTLCRVLNCSVTGGTISGCAEKGRCGGVVGYIGGSATVDGCMSSISVSTGSPLGGIIGKIYGNNNLVSNSMYYNGDLEGVGDNGGVGGIAGICSATSTSKNTIVNCAAYPAKITYSKGSVSGISGSPAATVTNCYSPVDGGTAPSVASLNTGAQTYNSGSPMYDIKACGWVMGTNGYPVLEGSPLASVTPVKTKTKVALMGDSISTYSGWTPYPAGYGYPLAKWPDVTSVNQVYWHKLIYDKMTDCELDVNSAYSGTCVQNTTRYGHPGCGFLQRYVDLKEPDIILINGGTNDCYYGGGTLPLGTLDFDLPDDQLDSYTFAGAYDLLIRLLKAKFPSAKFGLIIGDYPVRNRPEGAQIIKDIADHYGFPYAVVSFSDLDSYTEDGIHPNALGHNEMANQIWKQFEGKF